jgi:hypothetical protein
MRRNIAIVANGEKFLFFFKIFEVIKEKNTDKKINIFWICISNEQFNYITEKGCNPNNILLINWEIRNGNGKEVGDYKINELASADRQLKNHFSEGLVYLKKMQSIFFDFVYNNSIQLIFGEMTWAHEILMSRICLDKFKKKCFYLHPQSIRIPNGRFTMLDSEFQNSIFSPVEFIQLESELEKFEVPIQPVVPQRVAEVEADIQRTLTWKYRLRRLVEFLIINRLKNNSNNSDSLQNLGLPPWKRRKMVWQLEMKKLYYTKVLKKISLEFLNDKKFFFITLHMQPEASVDVVGRYYEDQFQVIYNVWRILPSECYLVVKEHTNAIGNRGKEFFQKCMALNNVLIINEFESSHKILKRAETVFTNSGTVALEGALFGKDVFLFSHIFFDKIKYCHKISLEDLKYTNNFNHLLEICRERDRDKMTITDYSKYIIRSSFPGVIDPHTNSPLFNDRNNIGTIAESFISFFDSLEYKFK